MRFLDHDAVNAEIGPRSRVQIWRDVKADRFPRPVLIGGRKAWIDREVASYQRWRQCLRDGETTMERWSQWWKLDCQRAEREAAA
jgi:predicted DNA-binding transcriptional regulator AlpA